MTQKFVTLPREVVENALDALNEADLLTDHRQDIELRRSALVALRAALEQPQNHVPDVGNMVQSGWKLVPVEPTCGMVLAGEHSMKQHDFFRLDAGYRAMLAAAPQHPTTEQYSEVEQSQAEQKPRFFYDEEDALLWTPEEAQYGPEGMTALYTNPQPQQEPLSTARIDELIEEGIFGGNPYELVRRLEEERGVFMTRPLTDEQVLKAVRHLYQSDIAAGMGFSDDLDVARAIEAAHNIK